MRKDAEYDVVDRINVSFETDPKLNDYVTGFSGYITSEVLADSLNGKIEIEGVKEEFKIGDFDCTIVIKKV